ELVNIPKPLLELLQQPLLCAAAVEDAVAERHDDVAIEAALAVALWVRLLADGLGVVAPVARVVRADPQPPPTPSVPPHAIAGLEELGPAPACREGVVPCIAKRPAE
ncbi:hypothetical protein V492_08033, partial [Pseudogymnoascus sp. VKM F-4246]